MLLLAGSSRCLYFAILRFSNRNAFHRKNIGEIYTIDSEGKSDCSATVSNEGDTKPGLAINPVSSQARESYGIASSEIKSHNAIDGFTGIDVESVTDLYVSRQNLLI